VDAVTRTLERLFEEDVIEFDEGGYLACLVDLMPSHAPSLLFLAGSDGSVTSANDLGSGTDLSLAKGIAMEVSKALDHGDHCALAKTIGTRSCCAFGVRLGAEEGAPLLGGLWEGRDGQPPKCLDGILPALKVCGRLAWLGTQTEQDGRMQRTRIQHLQAEHETLKAAHTEATVAAIEEHERRLREEQEKAAMEQQCAAIEAAHQAKSEFLANMSHEIRTPLTAIMGFTDLLRNGADGGDEAERRDYLNTIHASATHLLDLINDILDLSKIEAGRMQVEKVPCSPRDIVASVLSLMRVRAKEKGLSLMCEWPDGSPATILTDPLRLRQLLMNLVGNAVKFTAHGGVRLVCRLPRTPDRHWMRFDVIDTGIGIAPDKLESIFDAFVQADNSVTREYGGTGLGLAISRHIARTLGGDLSVQSELGKGSVFTATIDIGSLEGVAVLNVPPADGLAAPQPEERPEDVSMSHRQVLLVDDGSTNRKVISLFLRKAGADVTTAENGQIGVQLAVERPFDVILMDMQMPVMDGYTATRRLRQLGLKTPIIALTAHAMSQDKEKCLQAGCTAYLSKPVNSQLLLRTIADAMASTTLPMADAGAPAEAPTAAPTPQEEGPLVSKLPIDDPDFREIVEDFVVFLKDQLDIARRALSKNDATTIASVAHSLKGTAGGAGFDAFTEPAKDLERSAKNGLMGEMDAALGVLEQLAKRIAVIP
jgi:signal transduction histidine kinase/CheY-like chemotaxis protein